MQRIIALAGIISAAALVVLNRAAIDLSWYWTYKWIDLPMHFLGGFSIGLLLLYIGCIVWQSDLWEKHNARFLLVLIPLIVIGIVWELFEIIIGFENLASLAPYIGDTALDLLMDILGGLAALFLFRPRKKADTVFTNPETL